MIRKILFLGLIGFILSCQPPQNNELIEGAWKAELKAQNQAFPFNFTLNKIDNQLNLTLINGKQEKTIKDIQVWGDSIRINMPVLDASLIGTFTSNSIQGLLVKNYLREYTVPFTAEAGKDYRFASVKEIPDYNFGGRYRVQFSHKSTNEYAVGVFEQTGSKITGTFLKTTGDYRFLSGEVVNNEMNLSGFNGEHLYLFKAKRNDDGSLSGEFWSGKTFHATWTATPNENIQLPDANSLTFVEDTEAKVKLDLPLVDGGSLTYPDASFDGKVTILQILGSWCPNCLDESAFLANYYKENRQRGLRIVGLGYERKADFDYASRMLKKLRKRFGIEYDLVVAGKIGTKNVEKTFPMLNHIMSFPTTIIIDKKGIIRNIHTGFNGPATGKSYEEYVKEFRELMDELLQENY